MKINRLFIRGYGRLSDRQFEFGDKLNVIYGQNERGKSTLHSFIEQMFYHGYKTGYKKRQLGAALLKYKPWGKSSYSGTMTISDPVVRSIEKDFSGKHPKVNIYDDAGNEVSGQYQLDEVYREPKFGQHHFGLSKVMFKNTVSIGQLSKQTDGAAVAEIKKYVGNIEKSRDATLSVQSVQARIAEQKEQIGRKTKKQSRYAVRERRLAELADMRQRALDVAAQVVDLQSQTRQIDQSLSEIDSQIDRVERQLDDLKKREDNLLKQKADRLLAQIDQLQVQAEALQPYRAFSYDKVSQLNQLREQLQTGERAVRQQRQIVDRLAEDCRQLTDDAQTDDLGRLQAERAALKADLAELEALRTAQTALDLRIAQLAAKCSASSEVRNLPEMVYIVVFLAMLGLAFFLTKVNLYLAGVVLFTLVPSAFLLLKRRQKRQLAERQSAADRQQLNDLEAELAGLRQSRAAVLKKYQADDSRQIDARLTELNDAIGLANWQRAEAAKNAARKAELTAQLAGQQRQLDALQADQSALQERRLDLFKALDITTFDVIDQYHAKQIHLKEVEREQLHLRDLLAQTLAGRDYDSLQFVEVDQSPLTTDREALLAARNDLSRRQIEGLKEREKLTEQIVHLTEGVKTIQSIEEESEALLRARDADDRRLQILDIIATKIESTIDNVQKTVMPEVNRAIGQIVETVTAGKYVDVKVNGELGVFVVDRQDDKTVPLESLSAGTIDLLYIGLRIALADLLNGGKAVPLLFDDSFAQLDDQRLAQLLRYLATLDRQILIFTCQQRERQLLDRLQADFQFIEL